MQTVYEQNEPAIKALIVHYQNEVAHSPLNVVSVAYNQIVTAPAVDWTSLVTRFLASVTSLLNTSTGDPAQKKAAAVAAVVQFYHDVIQTQLVNAVGRPFIFNTFIGPAIENALPTLAGNLYDVLSTILTRVAGGTAPVLPGVPVLPAVPGLPTGFVPY